MLVEIAAEVWEADYEGELDYTPVPFQLTAPDPDAVREAARMLLAAKTMAATTFNLFLDSGLLQEC